MKKTGLLLWWLLSLAIYGGDMAWTAKDHGKVRDTAGIYISWSLGLRLEPGEYRVFARVSGTQSAVFTLKAINSASGQSFWSKGLRVKKEPAEMDFGTMVYNGQFPLTITDWNQPGFQLISVRLSLVKAMPGSDTPHAPCDGIDGWQCLDGTVISLSPTDRKEGSAALKVQVEPRDGRKWYDAGILRPMIMKKAGMISFWIKFIDDPVPFWVQVFAGDKGGVAQNINPATYNMAKGEWSYIELPIPTFHYKPQRAAVENVRALQFSPAAGIKKPVIFLIDDILIEP